MTQLSGLTTGEIRTVKIPNDFFLKACVNDYNDYRAALPREIYQNSIDAKAKNIHCIFDHSLKTVTIIDDGVGMDEDTILNKLLVMGGSSKDNNDSVGTFGKAKELIFFAWDQYEIHTRDNVVVGHASNYSIKKTNEYFNGTQITLIIADSDLLRVFESRFAHVANLCSSDCKIFINEELVNPSFKRKRLVADYKWASLYRTKVDNGVGGYPRIFVRINGVWMFTDSISYQDNYKYDYILEINQSEVKTEEALTSNRDGFKSKYRHMFYRIENFLSEESISTQKKEKKNFEKKVHGRGVFVFEGKAEKDIYDMPHVPSSNSLNLNSHKPEAEDKEEPAPNGYETEVEEEINGSWELVKNTQRRERGDRFDIHLDAMLKKLGWAHSFEVFTPSNTAEATQFLKSDKCVKFVRMWIDAIHKVCIDNEKSLPIVPGIFFDKFDSEDSATTLGQMRSNSDGSYSILVNATYIIKTQKMTQTKSIWRDKKAMFRLLLDMACHEIAHIYSESHDQKFASIDFNLRSNLV